MVTYVNSVLVGLSDSAIVAPTSESTFFDTVNKAGQFVIQAVDASGVSKFLANFTDLDPATYTKFRIGMATKESQTSKPILDSTTGNVTNGNTSHPIVRWTNWVDRAAVRGKAYSATYTADVQESVKIDFSSVDANVITSLAEGGKRVIIRIQYKDLPTRYRKWSETYEYVTKVNDTAITIAEGLTKAINYQYKRARISASYANKVITLTALPYDDDNVVDSISPASNVRFTVNVFWTDPSAMAFASQNKYFIKGLSIAKIPGTIYKASAKLVRDREIESLGNLGIINRGQGTWPIIKPQFNTVLDGQYNSLTFQFENQYRTADDWIKRTKQSIELYVIGTGIDVAAAATAINKWVDEA